MCSMGVVVYLGVTILAVLLTVDTTPSKTVIGLGRRKCAEGAVEQEMCTNTGDPDQPEGLCLPYSHPHTIANYPQCSGSTLDPQDGHGMDSRLICVPPIRCDAFLPIVYFGSWALKNASESAYPATVSLTCLHGYKLAGSSTVECRVNGTWEETTSECQPVYCGAPPLYSINGTWIPEGNMTYGDVAPLVCETGYWDDSCSFIVCQADGNWRNSTASCTPIDCGFPPPLIDGEFTVASTTYLSVGVISCKAGYLPSDSTADVTCGANKSWSTSQATCEPVDCGDPPLISLNGTWIPEGNMTNGDVAPLVCDAGYWDDSCSFIVCQADGDWSSSTASCAPINCGFPPPLIDGEFTVASTTYLSVGVISCKAGYLPSDSTADVTCGANKSWSTSQATCEPVDCGDPPLISLNGTWIPEGNMTYGDVAPLVCDAGYWDDSCSFIVCQADGDWSSSTASCAPINCGFPPPLIDGEFTVASTTYLSVGVISCKAGYSPSDSTADVTCGANKSWSTSQATCEPVGCGGPPLISNGTWIPEGNMTYGDFAPLVCETGYWDDSCSFIVCQADGNWRSSTASCTPIDCGFPPPIINGEFMLNSSTYLSVGTISCSDGFAPSDPNSTVICGADRRWSTPLATCERVECEDGWDKVGETCYIHTESGTMNFNAAIVYCVSLGGYLVAIETPTENILLKAYANAESVDEWWIAITDAEIDGWWKFAESGANVTFFDWAPNQPNNWGGEQDCGSMWFSNTGWQDAACSLSLTVICEKSL